MVANTVAERPPHPGGYVKGIIDSMGLSVTMAAEALGITRPALSKLLNKRARLSSDMALRIEKAFGASMDSLMQMQSNFDVAEARQRAHMIKVAPYKGRPLKMQSTQA
ncbi:HigA family addiction module antitoxin [Pseudomonas sp. LF-5]|uniref:HigA family addiction module antitoxin n=1 Tax=Pseudomonas sp. LF-5 TaxID=3031121 RepID=UPI00309B2703